MALRAVPDHPKFAELKTFIGRPKGAALGWLETIWHFCGKFTPQGNIGKYSDSAIEAWVEWDGEPGKLIAGLVESGWLDRNASHRLVVHDWHNHADQTTRKQLGRMKLEFISKSDGDIDERTGERDGYVYYAKNGQSVKIGYSKNPWSRVEELKCASPDIELLAIEKGTMALEGERHQEFSQYRKQREWFEYSTEIQNHVARINSSNSVDPVVATERTVATTNANSVGLRKDLQVSGAGIRGRYQGQVSEPGPVAPTRKVTPSREENEITPAMVARGVMDETQTAGEKNLRALTDVAGSIMNAGAKAESVRDHMASRWREYLAAVPKLKWNYSGIGKFFEAGMWDKPDLWPWGDGHKPQATGRKYANGAAQ